MNAPTKAPANVATTHTTALNKQFKKVQDAATEFETAEGDTGTKLNAAMSKLFEFGEKLIGSLGNPDESTFIDFLKSHDVKINAVKRRNPYVALTELSFTASSSSLRSQRAKVLAFARQSGVSPSGFGKWIAEEGGLKGRLKEAGEFFGSATQANNQTERRNRLGRARDYLSQLPSLADFNLDDVPDGFAIVLARITDKKAQAVQVLAHEHNLSEKLDAALVPFDPAGPARRQLLASLPLGQLWRAIDLIFLATSAKQASHVRSIALRNTIHANKPVCEVLSVSAARHEATATVRIAGHIGSLPQDEIYVLHSAAPKKEAGESFDSAAELFHRAFPDHANWTVQGTSLTADGLAFPINLVPLPDDNSYRVADDLAATRKTFSVGHEGMIALLAYVDAEAMKARATSGAKQVHAMHELMEMDDAKGEFRLRSIGSREDVLIGRSNYVLDPELRDLAYADLQRVAKAFTAYEADATGFFLDGQTDDACVRFDGAIDKDELTIIIPTRSNEVRNQFRVPLTTGVPMQEAA